MKITRMDLENEEDGEFEPVGPQGPMPRIIACGSGAAGGVPAEAGIAPASEDNGGDGNG